MNTVKLFSVAAAGLLVAGTAQATSYSFSSSTGLMDNVRHIGGALIPEIYDYAQHGGSLDATDPANWTLMITSQPGVGFGGYDPNNAPLVAPTRGGISVAIQGSVTVVGGVVTAAVLQMASGEQLRYAHFQSCNANANPPPDYSSCTATDLVAQNLIWTYNPVNNTLVHQTDLPNNTTNDPTRTAFCAVSGGDPFWGGSSGTGLTGQCGVIRNPVSGATATGMWTWDGMSPNYTVIDSQMALYHTGTNLTLDIGGASGHAGVVWDLSGFVEGVGGVIKAHVVAGAVGNGSSVTPGNSTGVAATYTINIVPVPAAVWLLGSALGLLGFARRWTKASA